MSVKSPEYWLAYFHDEGYPQAETLASGMEGNVYSLVPGELVAKVWFKQSFEKTEALKRFYETFARGNLIIQTPELLEIAEIDGVVVSTEQFLSGTPLQHRFPIDSHSAEPQVISALITALDFLRHVPVQEQFMQMTALDEAQPFWSTGGNWSECLHILLSTSVDRFDQQLRRHVTDFDRLFEAVTAFVQSRSHAPLALMHGDLYGSNILVDADMRPLAILDFGFLTLVGDPAFDAAITSSVMDMYGTGALTIDQQLTEAFALALEYDPAVLMGYKAVYALITSNAYSSDEADGHFRWAVNLLSRSDIRESLNM